MLARGLKPALLRPKEAAAGWPCWAGAPLGPEPRACPQASTQLPQWARAPWEASQHQTSHLHLSEGGSGWQEQQAGLAPLQMVSSGECGWGVYGAPRRPARAPPASGTCPAPAGPSAPLGKPQDLCAQDRPRGQRVGRRARVGDTGRKPPAARSLGHPGVGDLDGTEKSEVSQMGRGHDSDSGQKEGRDRALPACSGLREAPSALTVQVTPGNLVPALLSVEEAAVILSAT